MIEPFTFYNSGRLKLFSAEIDWENESTIFAVLLHSDYSPDSSHEVISDILSSELLSEEFPDYSRALVENRVIEANGTDILYKSDTVMFGMDVDLSAQYIGLAAGDPDNLVGYEDLIGYIDFGETKHSVNSEFSYTPENNAWIVLEET